MIRYMFDIILVLFYLVFLLEIINVCLVTLSEESVKNLVAIPQDVRELLDLKPGDKII